MAGSTVARLNFMYTANASNFMAVTGQIQNSLNSLNFTVRSLAFGYIAQRLASFAAQMASFSIAAAATFENMRVSMRTFVGDIEVADEILGALDKHADVTPFTTQDLTRTANGLLSVGVSAETVVVQVKNLANLSRGSADNLYFMAKAFQDVAAAGRLTGQELMQFKNAGFNPLEAIAQQTGESMAALKERMEAGGVSFLEVSQAVEYASSAFGRFFKMNEQLSQTFDGRLNTLMDTTIKLAREIGEFLIPTLTIFLEKMQGIVGMLKTADMETVRYVASLVAFTAGFAGMLFLFPKIVAGVTTVINAIRALIAVQITAQMITQGFAGALQVITGLAAAGLAVQATDAAIVTMMKNMEEYNAKADANAKAIQDAQQAAAAARMSAIDAVANNSSARLKELQAEAEMIQKRLDATKDSAKALKDSVKLTGAAERFTVEGFKASIGGAAQDMVKATIEKAIAEDKKNTEKLERRLAEIKEEIRRGQVRVTTARIP